MRALVDLLLPPSCPGCGREDALICEDCRRHLERRLGEPAGAPIGMPVAMPSGLLQLEWCATYSGPVRAALHALKYGAERRLAAPLGAALASRWARVGAGGEIVTWVPVHAARRRDRGFDQAEELARAMAGALQLPAMACLERQRRTVAQHDLDRRARAANVSGVFAATTLARPSLRGRWLIVVDDIVTTGATLTGCASVLLEAGAAAVSAMVVARDR